MSSKPHYNWIPTQISQKFFDEFISQHLTSKEHGPSRKLTDLKLFNYILLVIHTGCQWKSLQIERNVDGTAEIHYTSIYKTFRLWSDDECFDNIITNTVQVLHDRGLLDTAVIHGDGTTTSAKKGGDNIGRNGHKHMKGDKVVAFCDRNCNILAPFVTAPGNRNESPMFKEALGPLKKIASAVGYNLNGSIMSLDGAYDCKANRKMIFNSNMKPNINENKRNKKKTKRGRKSLFSPEIFKERFQTIERVFAWEDKFKRLIVRFEHLSHVHYAMKMLAFSLINLRYFTVRE